MVSTRSPIEATSLQRSSFVHLLRADNGCSLAYHSLFGNLAWLDHDLHRYIAQASEPIAASQLWTEVGSDVAEVLWASYFFVESPHEERRMIEEWLREREAQLQTGYYLGGLQISSSNACNFACSYCFADASDRRSDVRQSVAAGPVNISFDLASRAIDQVAEVARQHGRNRIAVKFLGREPLINWKTIRRLLTAYDNRRIAWSITTNGSLLDTEVAEAFKRHDVRVMVSLDGPARVNDQLRVLKRSGGGPTYQAIEAALSRLAAAGHPFGVSTVISAATDFEIMPRFIDRLVELGAREVELTLAMQVTEIQAQSRHSDIGDFVARLTDLYEYATGRGLLVHGDWVDPFQRILTTHKFRSEPRVNRPLGVGCTATEHQISLEPSGDVFPCRAMSLHYGHMDNLAAVLAGDEYRHVGMRTFYNVPRCHGCVVEGHCQGTCLGSLEEASGDIYDPQEGYCTVYREATMMLLNRLALSKSVAEPCHA